MAKVRKKRITAKQKAARKKNIEIARRHKKKGSSRKKRPSLESKFNTWKRAKGGGWKLTSWGKKQKGKRFKVIDAAPKGGGSSIFT